MNAASHHLLLRSDFLQNSAQALTGVAQWVKHPPADRSVAGSVPVRGTCLGCGPVPIWGVQGADDPCFSCTLTFLFLFFFSLPLSVKQKINKIFK